MNRRGVLSEPRAPRPLVDSQETSPLLTAYQDHFHVASEGGGSAVDGTAVHRSEQDGKNIQVDHKIALSE
jgi:hypothetical protein